MESDSLDVVGTEREELLLFTVGHSSANSSFPIEVKVNRKPLVMEIDTGAAVSIVAAGVVKEKFPEVQIQPSSVLLKTYTGEVLDVVGELPVW